MADARHLHDLKSLFERKRLYLGLSRTVKALKAGRIAKVYMASNTPKEVKSDLTYYGMLSGAEIVLLEQPNKELGIAVRKPFPISVIGVVKE